MSLNTKKDNKIYILFIILFHALFLLISLWIKGIYTLDSSEYLWTASNLLDNCTAYNGPMQGTLNSTLFTLRPPGYPVFIALCKTIAESDLMIILIQNFLSITLCVFIYDETRKLFSSRRSGFVILAGLILFPIYLILVNMVMAEGLLAILLTVALFQIKLYLENGKWQHFLLYNLLLSLAVLTKPVMMYFWIPNLIFSVYLFWKYRQKFILVFSLLLPLTIGLWSYRNFKTTGFFEYSSIKTQNLLELNAGSIVSFMKSHEEMKLHRKEVIQRAESLIDYGERSEFLMKEAKDIISDHPVLYIWLHCKGMLNFLLAPGRVDIEIFFNIKQNNEVSLLYEVEKKGFYHGLMYYAQNVNGILLLSTVLIFSWNIFLLISLIFSFFTNKMSKDKRIAIFMIVFYVIFASGPGGYARFKVAIYPIMLFMLPYGIDAIKTLLRKVNVLS